jgi:uncharacterized protein (TIGR02449 family)
MEELLQRLEKKIKDLADQHDQLKHSHLQLHLGKSILVREKDALLAKQQKAISQIEILINRLKAIEKQS